jgi:hypothetical protein
MRRSCFRAVPSGIVAALLHLGSVKAADRPGRPPHARLLDQRTITQPMWRVSLRTVLAATIIALFGFEPVQAEPHDTQLDVDSEHIFGLTSGTDIGNAGEIEGEIESVGRFGKSAGRYAVTSTAAVLKYTVIENFRVAPSFSIVRHDIAGVPGFDDRKQWAFDSAGLEFKYRLLDRKRGPFGLVVGVDPHWSPIDSATGARADQYTVNMSVALDKEIVSNRLYGAINVLYGPQWIRQRTTNEWERASTIGFGSALTAQWRPGFLLGAGMRYLRIYDGIGLNAFSGEALFAGPHFFVKLSERWNVSGAWNVQVVGRDAAAGGALDLTNFERHQVQLRLGAAF